MELREEEVRFEMVQNQIDVINRLEKIAGDLAETRSTTGWMLLSR